jgi:hypothetical protein
MEKISVLKWTISDKQDKEKQKITLIYNDLANASLPVVENL